MKLPLGKALSWIALSALLVNGLAFLALQGYFAWRDQKRQMAHSYLQTIIQTGPQKEALKTDYLAELIGLSRDYPTKVEDFDLQRAAKQLCASAVIKEAVVEVVDLGTLYINYTVRQPIALVADFENRAIDEEQALFPLAPFFPPKNLPSLYLGIQNGFEVKSEKTTLALCVLRLIQTKPELNIRLIDVSKAFERSLGRQEIVVLLEDEFLIKTAGEAHYFLPQYLRLSRTRYAQELGNYLKLREALLKKTEEQLMLPKDGQTHIFLKPKIIDLRLEQLAFVNE